MRPAQSRSAEAGPHQTTSEPAAARAVWSARTPAVPLLIALALLALILLPRIAEHRSLVATFAAVGALLAGWGALLWASARGRTFRIEFVPIRSHYVQASVQACIYAYWGWYWPNVYPQVPLILAQVLFLYALDALLCWTRGRAWRLGFGPLPIIFSTNLFMWFRDDWFAFQFVMVALGALGKEFIRWDRDGRNTHVFNPSAFGLCLVSLVLIAAQTTHRTWGVEIATTLGNPPHIYLEIFLLGLVVQYFFSVTLMTLSAAGTLYLMNVAYTRATGTYQFLDTNIPIAVFLGLHLLMTDPATSPRSNVGKVMFGALYGAANFVLYDALAAIGAPEFYDKLLPVPVLNLLVPWIDRVAQAGFLGRFTLWEARFDRRKLNLAHMACWIALFGLMLGTGFVEAPHPGSSPAFWKQAWEEGRPKAGERYLKLVNSLAASGSGPACNELGVIYMEGKLGAADHAAAAHYFARACELGDVNGCANTARQFLFQREARSEADARAALDRLEAECAKGSDARACFLVGFAHEKGWGRPADTARAAQLYASAAALGSVDACKGLARIGPAAPVATADLARAAATLERACAAGDTESCKLLAALGR
jgi:hypothetical protein